MHLVITLQLGLNFPCGLLVHFPGHHFIVNLMSLVFDISDILFVVVV